jgi:hypothetical protein
LPTSLIYQSAASAIRSS